MCVCGGGVGVWGGGGGLWRAGRKVKDLSAEGGDGSQVYTTETSDRQKAPMLSRQAGKAGMMADIKGCRQLVWQARRQTGRRTE